MILIKYRVLQVIYTSKFIQVSLYKYFSICLLRTHRCPSLFSSLLFVHLSRYLYITIYLFMLISIYPHSHNIFPSLSIYIISLHFSKSSAISSHVLQCINLTHYLYPHIYIYIYIYIYISIFGSISIYFSQPVYQSPYSSTCINPHHSASISLSIIMMYFYLEIRWYRETIDDLIDGRY